MSKLKVFVTVIVCLTMTMVYVNTTMRGEDVIMIEENEMAMSGVASESAKLTEEELLTLAEEKGLSTIYMAGGCFWGVEAYLSRIAGVYDVTSGYANGKTESPTYEDVLRGSGHAETVRVMYDSEQVSLDELLTYFFKVVDPTTLNRQGPDVGVQYRSGIYFENESDEAIIDAHVLSMDAEYEAELEVEVLPLEHFYLAEEYHQDYLQKNPNGYCHINLNVGLTVEEAIDPTDYALPTAEEIRDRLNPLEFDVTQNKATEMPFSHEYDSNFELGIYVDIVTGEPLFSSKDKYDAGCGWPSFTRPIAESVIVTEADYKLTVPRTEVLSRSGDTHLGHVFEDGPVEDGGLRYCINGAALRFVPYADMVEEGYGYLMYLLE